MAYDEELARRIRELLAPEPAVTETTMFGGLAFLVGGNMAVGASGRGGLMVRVNPAETDTLVETTDARPMEMRGRPMQGWLRIGAQHVEADDRLAEWVERGAAAARALPAKEPKP